MKQEQTARTILKITVTKTVKIEIMQAEADKKTACCCGNNCKR